MPYRSSVDFSGAVDDSGDPDIVYYNAQIINDNQLQKVDIGLDPVVRFQETRSVPLIKDISQFYFSIVRFTMNGPNKDLPIFIPAIQTGQSDINLTAYSVGLDVDLNAIAISVGGYAPTSQIYTQAFIPYISETIAYYTQKGQNLPNPPLKDQDIRGIYYYVFTYQHWLDLINFTFATMVDTIQAPNAYYPQGSLGWTYGVAWSSAGTGLAQTASTFSALPAPSVGNTGQYWRVADTGYWYVSNGTTWGNPITTLTGATNQNNPLTTDGTIRILYNPTTTLFTLYYPKTYCASKWWTKDDITGLSTKLWFNSNMFGLFANWNNTYNGDETTGKVYQIIVQNLLNTNAYNDGANDYYTLTQEYNSTSTLWSPIESIVFTSTLIPIFPEQVGEPIVYGGGNDNANSNNSTSAFSPIITDIALPMQTAHDYREFLEYAPTAEYRLSAFTSSKQELRNIDVQVFWKSRLDNNLYPVRMFNQSSVSIKMMFRKKEGGR